MQGVNSTELESAAKLVRLILANYRGANQILPDAENVESMLLLIRMANADAVILQWAAQFTGEPIAVLQRSAIAFIEHSFFAPGKDHFAVLGLNPWANATDIKEHYRLLIRVFHPDRNHVVPERAARYSALINQAYSALKIEVPNSPSAIPVHKLAQQQSRRNYSLSGSKFGQHLAYTWLIRQQWLTPSKIMLSVIMVAGVCVAITLHSFKGSNLSTYDVIIGDRIVSGNLDFDAVGQPNLIVESALSIAERSEAEHIDVAAKKPDESEINSTIKLKATLTTSGSIKERTETKSSINGAAGSMLQIAPVLAKPAVKLSAAAAGAQYSPTAPKPLSANSSYLTFSSRTTSILDDNKQLLQSENNHSHPEKILQTTPPAFAQSETAAINVADKSALANESQKLKASSSLPNDYELRGLIAHFAESYQHGDIQEFMLLFSNDVDAIEEGGRLGLQDTYGNFFNNTQSRVMIIKDLSWKPNGNVIIGTADYRTTVLRKNTNMPFESTGSFKFKVAKADGNIKIVSFYHLSNTN